MENKMNPLTHSTPHQDLRDWRKEDKRLQAFKNSQWERIYAFDPFRKFIALELKLFLVLTTIIFGVSFYLGKKSEKEMDRYLKEWRNHKLLNK